MLAARFRTLTLRTRLILAFLAVSVIPVLVASYVAAATIENAFRANVERWLDEAVRFLASETLEARQEAEKAAEILAKALSDEGEGRPESGARPFAELLVSTGYDLVQVFGSNGQTSFSLGPVSLNAPPPLKRSSAIMIGQIEGHEAMMVGAVSPFTRAGEEHFVFTANLIDAKLFGISRALSTLDVMVARIVNGQVRAAYDSPVAAPRPVPPAVLARLTGGSNSAVDGGNGGFDMTAYAALRGSDGELLGVISCRLGSGSTFAHLGQTEVFALLALLAGLISLMVAVVVANRISQPVRAASRGVAAVAAGNYEQRLDEEGGAEFSELARGFNSMVSQLARLRAMEADMRKRQQFAALGEAAAVIAHEIRNPLGIMKTSSDVVRLRGNLSPENARLIGFVQDEIARIGRLVDDILEYVRPSRGEIEPLDMAKLLAGVAESMRTNLSERRIGVVLEVEDQLSIAGARDRITQLILNLALNAADAMPEGGTLTLKGHAREGRVMIEVGDTGIGIRPEDLARIYDPFFTTKARGTGLGLAKASAIVEEHDGQISCATRPGEGSVFTLAFPARSLKEA